MKKILLTGFEPFNNSLFNSSDLLVRELAEKLRLPFLILPVSYKASIHNLNQYLGKHECDFVLMLGQADRKEICLERVGLNLKDAKIPDSEGVLALGEKIDPKGEGAIFSELPLAKWTENSEMIVSNSAGTYVCNLLYYKILQGSYKNKCLFVHVPSVIENKDKVVRDLSGLIKKI